MWVGSVSFREMRNRSRWRVELFCGEPTQRHSSPFEWGPLRELVEERQEALNPQDYPEHLFNYIGLENIQPVTGDLLDFQPKYGKEIRSKSKVFRQGDILYGRLRPYLNKVYLASGSVANGICSGEFYVLVPHRQVDPHLLRARLASRYVHPYVAALQTGSALPRLELQDLLDIEVPLPPPEEQRMLARFLEEQTHYRRALAAQLSRLPAAVLDALMASLESGGRPVLPEWEQANLTADSDPNPLPSGDFTVRRKPAGTRTELPLFTHLDDRAQ